MGAEAVQSRNGRTRNGQATNGYAKFVHLRVRSVFSLLEGAVKSKELANLCLDTIDETADVAEVGLNRIGSDAPLCLAFLRHCGLRL